MASVTIPPTAISLSPSLAAFSRSTTIDRNGCDAERLLLAWATTESFFTFVRMAAAPVRRSALLPAVTLIAMSDDANPPCAA